jgi:hypothetical protein
MFWDPDVGSWMYPAGVWYDGYDDSVVPSTIKYRANAGGWILLDWQASIGESDLTAAATAAYGYQSNCTFTSSVTVGSFGQRKNFACTGTINFGQIEASGSGCVPPQVYLPNRTCGPPPVGVPQSDPATDEQMSDAFDDHMSGNPNSMPELAEEGAKWRPIPLPPTMPPWSGPNSIPGDSTTKTETGPEGTTTTSEDTTHRFEYGNPTPEDITVHDDKTTTKTNPDGTTTTTTTTTTGTSTTGGGSGSGDKSPQINPCVANPNASGCAPLGPMDDSVLGKRDIDVSLSISGVAGSCPAPISLDVLGTSHQLSWQPVCDLATGVSPIVRALAALSAGLWLLFVLRK